MYLQSENIARGGDDSAPAPVPAPAPAPTPPPAPAPAPAPAPVTGGNVLFVGDGTNNVLAAFDILAPAGPGVVSGNILTSDFAMRNGGQFDASRNLLNVGAFKQVAVFANAAVNEASKLGQAAQVPVLSLSAGTEVKVSKFAFP